MTGKETLRQIQSKGGQFVKDSELVILAADPETRLQMILVRCGCGRFVAPAQDAQHFINIIERDAKNRHLGSDYIRDVSIPANGR